MNIKKDDFETLMLYSFRYALGRQTYAVSQVADLIIENIEVLSNRVLENIHYDIVLNEKMNLLGDVCDRAVWLDLKNRIEKIITGGESVGDKE